MATGRYSTSISLSFFDLQNIFSKVCHIVDHHHHHLFRAYMIKEKKRWRNPEIRNVYPIIWNTDNIYFSNISEIISPTSHPHQNNNRNVTSYIPFKIVLSWIALMVAVKWNEKLFSKSGKIFGTNRFLWNLSTSMDSTIRRDSSSLQESLRKASNVRCPSKYS